MKNETKIKIGSRQTQLFQRCPECNTLIRIPRKQEEFLGTPYYYWEFAHKVDCPKCYADWKFTSVKVDIPEDQRRIHTKNEVLYAFDIGMPPKKKHFDLDAFKDGKYSMQYSYVAIFEDGFHLLLKVFQHSGYRLTAGSGHIGNVLLIREAADYHLPHLENTHILGKPVEGDAYTVLGI